MYCDSPTHYIKAVWLQIVSFLYEIYAISVILEAIEIWKDSSC